MMLISRKRIIAGLSFSLLFMPTVSTKAYDYGTNNPVIIAGIIGAGIAGVCGFAYSLVKYFQKSHEQIADDAEQALNSARAEGRRFYSEYMNVFMPACGAEPTLDDIECNFLEAVASRMYRDGINVEAYIYTVKQSIESLEKALEEVKSAVKSLQSRNKTPLYDRLVNIENEIESQLGYLKDYHQRFSEHSAYFALAVFELKLHNAHGYDIALLQEHSGDSSRLKKLLLQRAQAYSTYSDYPIVYYYELLRGYNETLNRYLRKLKYCYTKRVSAAKQLIAVFGTICNIIAATSAFREEREFKKADDARREQLELRRREVKAQADMAAAAERQAQAAKQQARAAELQAQAAQQQVYLKQRELDQPKPQSTVVVVNQH